MFGRKLLLSFILGMTVIGGNVMAKIPEIKQVKDTNIKLVQEWDKTFPKSDKIEHTKVLFKNRYGITLVGDLYVPKNIGNQKLAAITVSGAFGAVKEQSSGLYAQTLAERGFVTLAFDGSYTGESGGQPRNLASPEINTEDFSAAVDFLGTQSFVDRNKIGVLGICGWGGMALNVVAVDTRIKAVATSTMYDMTRQMSKGYNDSMTDTERLNTLKKLNEQRWIDVENGTFALTPGGLPENPDENIPKFIADYANYYKKPRGFHSRSINSNSSWTMTTPLSFMNMPLLSYAEKINIPTLIVAGEKAHSRYFSEDVYKAVGSKNKELYIVKNAYHVDLYDNVAGKIPYDKFESFFKANLK